MNVRLISITKSAINDLTTNLPSAESIIAYTARVSNPAGQMNDETTPKLLAYLIKNKHWSPFEMASFTVEINTSRAIAQQILRHRSFSFQEFSQRYAKVTDFVTYPARRQDKKNRQNSVDDLTQPVKDWFQRIQDINNAEAMQRYNTALDNGIAKEQARFLLPVATATTMYMNGNVRSWIHYIQLRTEAGTQKEHRDIAEAIKVIFVEQFPNIAEALEWK